MLDWVVTVMQARAARRGARIQALWQGYGEVFRVELDGGLAPTAIVKSVRPPASERATRSDERKRRSYEVELALPEPGAYYLTFAVPSLGISFSGASTTIVRAADPAAGR